MHSHLLWCSYMTIVTIMWSLWCIHYIVLALNFVTDDDEVVQRFAGRLRD